MTLSFLFLFKTVDWFEKFPIIVADLAGHAAVSINGISSMQRLDKTII